MFDLLNFPHNLDDGFADEHTEEKPPQNRNFLQLLIDKLFKQDRRKVDVCKKETGSSGAMNKTDHQDLGTC